MRTIQSLLLASFLMLVKVNAEGIYTLGVAYTKVAEDADCSKSDAKSMEKASINGLFSAGIIGDKGRDNWHGFDKGEPVEDSDEKAEETGQRRLCDAWCEQMFYSSGGRDKYYNCCSCCTRDRRRLRSLATVRIADDDPEQLVKLEKLAAVKVNEELLSLAASKVECLAFEDVVHDDDGSVLVGGYDVEVEIVPASVTDIVEFEDQREVIKKELRDEVRKQLKAARADLKAQRADLRELRAQIRAAKRDTKEKIQDIKSFWKSFDKDTRDAEDFKTALLELRLGDEEAGHKS